MNGIEVRLQEGLQVRGLAVQSGGAPGADDRCVVYTEEAKQGAELGLDEVERRPNGAYVINAAGGDEESRFLVLE